MNIGTPYKRYIALETAEALEGITSKQAAELEALRTIFGIDTTVNGLLRRNGSDIRDSLRLLESYSAAIKRSPFSGDLGAGNSKAMPIRYRHRGQIMGAAARLMSTLKAAYAELLLACLDSKAEKKISQIERSLNGKRVAQVIEAGLRKRYPEFYQFKEQENAEFIRLQRLLKKISDVKFRTLTPDMNLYSDLGLDSLDLWQLVPDLEESFSVVIEDEDMEGNEPTVGFLTKMLLEKLEE